MFDQTTKNGKDVKNNAWLLTAMLSGTNSTKDPNYNIKYITQNTLDPGASTIIDINTITTFYEHEGQVFIGSQRAGPDMEGYLCLTRIIDPRPIASFYTIHSTTGYICAETKGGNFFGMSNGNELVHLHNENAQSYLVTYSINDSDKKDITMSKLKRVNIQTDISSKLGIREVLVGTDAYTLRFSTDQGVSDSGDSSFTIVNTNKLSDEFYSAPQTTDIVIGAINLRASITGLEFRLLAQPFLFFSDAALANGIPVKVDITVSDMEEKPVVVKSQFTRFDDALSKVELDKYPTPTIEIDPVSLTKIAYPYSNVLMGNSLDFNVNLDPGVDSINTIQKTHLEQKIIIEGYEKITRRL